MDAAESQTSAETPAESEQLHRLRRQLRALSAVNRQLHAQLEGGTVRLSGDVSEDTRTTLTGRRTTEGTSWLAHLHLYGGGDPILVHTPTQGSYVVEGTTSRRVKSGILFNALIRVLGAPREMTDREIERCTTGPPVEVLEGGAGPAFVVVGGRRLPLRGLPLPYLVSSEDMLRFPEGEELNLSTPRPAPPGPAARARTVIERDGAVRGSAKLAKKAVRRVIP